MKFAIYVILIFFPPNNNFLILSNLEPLKFPNEVHFN